MYCRHRHVYAMRARSVRRPSSATPLRREGGEKGLGSDTVPYTAHHTGRWCPGCISQGVAMSHEK